MGMTAVEKTLALKSGRPRVEAGEVVYPQPDFIMIHDGVVMGAKRELDALGIRRLAAPDKVVMVTDHDVIYGSARAAERGAFNRAAAREWGVKNFFDVGRGGHGHIFPMETGMLLPGMFYFDNDRHSTNAGAIGAFGFRMGTEISRVLDPAAYPIVDLPISDPLFSAQFIVDEVPQITNIGFWRRNGGLETRERYEDSEQASFRVIRDGGGRIMVAMTHNTDVADSWEREGEDEAFFLQFSPNGYALGINVLLHAMTH